MRPIGTTKQPASAIAQIVLLLSLLLFFGKATAADMRYEIDGTVLKQLGSELYENLKPTQRAHLSPNPIWLKDEEKPYARPYMFESANSPGRVIYLSKGFILLAHHIAHAKAIDKVEPGFFNSFATKLAEASEDKLLPELPQNTNPRYWTDDIMNEQGGYFSQIVAGVAGIELAHHYLGHYDKYSESLRDSVGNPSTMTMACSTPQWDSAFKLGAANALDCGYAVEGLKILYLCIDKMPKRPRWTLYFLPPAFDIKKLSKDLDKIEAVFFGQTR